MSTTDILDHALQLSAAERAKLTHELLLSLEPEDFDEDWEAAWTTELEARLARIERGEITARDWRESLAEARRILAEERAS
jgi:hypothetical protein